MLEDARELRIHVRIGDGIRHVKPAVAFTCHASVGRAIRFDRERDVQNSSYMRRGVMELHTLVMLAVNLRVQQMRLQVLWEYLADAMRHNH